MTANAKSVWAAPQVLRESLIGVVVRSTGNVSNASIDPVGIAYGGNLKQIGQPSPLGISMTASATGRIVDTTGRGSAKLYLPPPAI